ncbi:acetylglutamate kinase [Paraliobacillus ryukyuensis]|uniref:acetylglutamate kinase n=1 Tax=Paraliobacillus ryukyuensis TaxID=200904 RepID=UPI0009A66D8D|nr:acetylglutamate kinase [Paraliobacillus ryukyuensis]
MDYIVIKCGGSIVDQLSPSFYKNVIELQEQKQVQPIIVHGGGPMISTRLKQMNVATRFVNGLRVTTKEVLDVVEMVLSGSVNKQMVRALLQQGGQAMGLSGIDGHLLHAKPITDTNKYGFVGEVEHVNVTFLKNIIAHDYIPIISPIAIGEQNQRYNINADLAAAAIAQALHANLCFISDIPGILVDKNGQKRPLHETTKKQIESLIASNIIYGGMIPKVQAALTALEQGAPCVAILDGMKTNSLTDFIAGKQVGTSIQLEEVSHVY